MLTLISTVADNVRPFGQMIAQNQADLRDANGKGKVITKIIAYGNGPAGPQPGVPAAEKARFAGPDIVSSQLLIVIIVLGLLFPFTPQTFPARYANSKIL